MARGQGKTVFRSKAPAKDEKRTAAVLATDWFYCISLVSYTRKGKFFQNRLDRCQGKSCEFRVLLRLSEVSENKEAVSGQQNMISEQRR